MRGYRRTNRDLVRAVCGWFLLSAFLGLLVPRSKADDDPAIRHNEAGVRLLEEKKFIEAIESFREAIKLRPVDETIIKNLATAHLMFGIHQLGQKSYANAHQQFKEGLARDPMNAGGHYHLGIALHFLSRSREAEIALEKAVEIDPSFVVAYDALAQCRYALGKIDKAMSALRKAIALAPDRQDLATRLKKFLREAEVEEHFVGQESSRFEIRFDADRESASFVRDILHELEEAYNKVGADLGSYPSGRIPVILYSEQEFSHVTGAKGWVGGLYDGKIRIPTKNIAGSTEQMRSVILHEYTHAVVSKLCSDVPAWLHEGLAQLEEGRSFADARRVVARALESDSLLRIEKLPKATFTVLRDPLVARRAYAWCFVLVAEMAARTSRLHIRQLIDQLAEKRSFDDAFRQVFGIELTIFEDEVRSGL